ncbi:MAG: methionine--tRNA ligase [Simkaniaceae bacterium]|nr:methionine--tRNA ligase [Simkaniaceae bacterium]
MHNKVLITAALPYANGPLHFGHIAGAYLPADCYARFQRLVGEDVFFVCGSDEHGVAITLSAEMAGRTPKEHVDLFHAVNHQFFQQLNISFDHYSRTTWEGHVHPSQQFFLDLLNNGYIEERVTDQLYSEQDHQFLADRYVEGTCPKCGFNKARGDECQKCGASYEALDLIQPHSKVTGSPLILKKTKHWFLRFDLFKDRLQEWLKSKPWKDNVLKFASHYIDELKPRAITRDSDWGIPVPLEEAKGKVLYVWFDAPIGYISASMEWGGDWQKYWLDPHTKLVQFIGKDNIPFHAIFFPAMVMGQNVPYKLVDELPANEFYNLEGKQFSKSDGWFIDLDAFFTQFTADQIRYTIAANAPETQDSEFTWHDFQMRCNSELVGKYGNFANRVLVFIANHFEHQVPVLGDLEKIDQDFMERVDELVNGAYEAYSRFHLRKATQLMMELASHGNVYFDHKKPWKDKENSGTTLAACVYCLKALALISFPVIPTSAEVLWGLLGFSLPIGKWNEVRDLAVPSLQSLPPPRVLFSKVENEVIAREVAKLASR